jgi:hypothetical protein
MDAAYADSCRADYCRCDVYRPDWDKLLQQFQNMASQDITRRTLGLGARDGTTGWRSKNYTETTIKGILVPRAASQLALQAGTYVRLDALFFIADGLKVGDEIKTAANIYHEVKTIREHWLGDSFYFRECDLTLLPFHE